MKKVLFAIPVLSISLFLCACGSSASESAGSQQTGTNDEPIDLNKDSGPISFDDFELTYTEKDTGLGYTGVYVSITNHSDFTVLTPTVNYGFKPGVTNEDIQAAMPNGLKFDPDRNESMGGSHTNTLVPYLKPSETSEEMEISINVEEYKLPGDGYVYVSTCPVTPDILDFLEVKNLKMRPIAGGKIKVNLELNPGDTIPVETVDDSETLLNEVVEGGKDLIIVPDSVTIYSTYEYNHDGFHGYGFDFYGVEDAAMDKCIQDYEEKFPIEDEEEKFPVYEGRFIDREKFFSRLGMYLYTGRSLEEKWLTLKWYKEKHVISGSIAAD